MQWVVIALCYLCFAELVLVKVLKKHRKLLSAALAVTAFAALISLFIWGLLRNF